MKLHDLQTDPESVNAIPQKQTLGQKFLEAYEYSER